jgi:uncharacterized protein (TIGR02466 family)
MRINYLFPTFYAEEKITLDNDSLTTFCYKQRKVDSGISLSNVGGWHSQFLDPWKVPELLELTEIVEQKISEVSSIMDFGVRAIIDKCFININQSGHSHNTHDHPGSLLSAVYYVNTGPGRGNLKFHSDNRLIEWNQRPDRIVSYNQLNSSSWSVVPKTGTLVIFPGWLKHQVEANTTQEDRISIVYNCPIEKDKL